MDSPWSETCTTVFVRYQAAIIECFEEIGSCSIGKIKCLVDLGHRARKGPFKGIESVADAVEVTIEYIMDANNLLPARFALFAMQPI